MTFVSSWGSCRSWSWSWLELEQTCFQIFHSWATSHWISKHIFRPQKKIWLKQVSWVSRGENKLKHKRCSMELLLRWLSWFVFFYVPILCLSEPDSVPDERSYITLFSRLYFWSESTIDTIQCNLPHQKWINSNQHRIGTWSHHHYWEIEDNGLKNYPRR